MPKYKATLDVLSKKQLTKLFGFAPRGKVIGTCAGEWRKMSGGNWRFYELADING